VFVADGMLYATDTVDARILAINLTSAFISVLYQADDDVQPYTVAASPQHVYFSAWNRKLVS